MSWPKPVQDLIARLRYVQSTLEDMFVERDEAIELLVLAALCQEHLLLLGPPGTAKTELINRFAELIEARRFHYLLTRFTEPSEVFGPLDLAAFQKGTYHIRVDGMLPSAEIAILDEVFQGSSAILNGFLTLIHERLFHNGAERQPVPLISLVGASNMLPEEPALRAFADRFLLRAQVNPVSTEHTKDLIEMGWAREQERIEAIRRAGSGVALKSVLTIKELTELHGRLAEVKVDAIRPTYTTVLSELRAQGLELSDRRAVKGLKLIAGHALLRGVDVPDARDLKPLLHIWNRPDDIPVLTRVLEPRLAEAGGEALSTIRPEEEISGDLHALEDQEKRLQRETGRVAHLAAYNELRREVLRDYPGNAALRQRIEAGIMRLLQKLHIQEGGHV